MVEWVTGHVLRHHLGMDRHIAAPSTLWDHRAPPLARERQVAILGLGALGRACAAALRRSDFDGHRLEPDAEDGCRACTACAARRPGAALRGREILVLLLPDTPQTEHAERRDAGPAARGRGRDQPRTRPADRRRRRCSPRWTAAGSAMPRSMSSARAAARRTIPSGPSQGDGDAARRLRYAARHRRARHRREHPPRRGRRGLLHLVDRGAGY